MTTWGINIVVITKSTGRGLKSDKQCSYNRGIKSEFIIIRNRQFIAQFGL